MSTLLKTVNPEAADITGAEPLPGVGSIVIYHLLPGQVNSGRTSVPALVLARDTDNRLLKLHAIYGTNDSQDIDRVPQRIGNERGWEYRPESDEAAIKALRGEIAEFSQRFENFMTEMSDVIWGENSRQKESLQSQISDLTIKLAAFGKPGKKPR